jgi:hypothetical protein
MCVICKVSQGGLAAVTCPVLKPISQSVKTRSVIFLLAFCVNVRTEWLSQLMDGRSKQRILHIKRYFATVFCIEYTGRVLCVKGTLVTAADRWDPEFFAKWYGNLLLLSIVDCKSPAAPNPAPSAPCDLLTVFHKQWLYAGVYFFLPLPGYQLFQDHHVFYRPTSARIMNWDL